MSAIYFSFDPENGIEFHDTEKEAESRVAAALESAIDYAADWDWNWTDNEGDISYGIVIGKVKVTDRPMTMEEQRENPEWDAIRSHKLESVGAPSPVVIDDAMVARAWAEYGKPHPGKSLNEVMHMVLQAALSADARKEAGA